MNQHRLPPDELASAFLDDELDAAEADAVRRDPALAATAEALGRVAEAVGEPVVAPPGAADAAVAAALADFDARSMNSVGAAARRSRNLRVMTGVAAAVAAGVIVAVVIGVFANNESDNETASVAPPPTVPAPAASPAAAAEPAPSEPPPPPEPAPADEPLPPPPAVGEPDAMIAPSVIAPDSPLALDEAQAAEAAAEAVQAAATQARAAAAAAEAETAAEPAQAQAAQAEDDSAAEVAADIGPEVDGEACLLPGDGATIETQFTIADTDVLVVRASDGQLSALNAATCGEIPAEDGADMTLDPTQDCAAAVGGAATDLRITVGDVPIVIVESADGRLVPLNATTCAAPTPPE